MNLSSFMPKDLVYPKAAACLTEEEKKDYIEKISGLLKEQNAAVIAHYYCNDDVQALAESTGGFIGDSLEMAKWGKKSSFDRLIVCGVRFMGETAKILSPEKTILMPSLKAECSANTSAAVKARADWVVTSSIAIQVVEHLHSLGKELIWAPDRHLGSYIERLTGADMLRWQAHCVVHDEFKAQALEKLKQMHPDAAVLVHPESPAAVVEMADVVGSTSQLLKAAKTLPNSKLIVATDSGIFYKLQQACPDKELIIAPTQGEGATCKSCAHCPWMAMNGLKEIYEALTAGQDTGLHEVHVDEEIRVKALNSLNRLLDFSEKLAGRK